MARGRPLSKKTRAAFLEHLRHNANVRAACREIGHPRWTMYQLRHRDPEFAAAWDEAIEDAIDGLEEEAWRRATEGYLEPVFQGGEKVGDRRKFSDRMLELLLTGNRKSKYSTRHEHTGEDGSPLTIEIVRLASDQTPSE